MSAEAAATMELESAPSLARLYAQAVLGPAIPGGGDELPGRRLVLRYAEVERERVTAYSRVCGFGVRTAVPATYPHVMAFPLHMCLMTDRSFPFSVLGLVHIANRIEVAAPVPIGSRLALTVWAEDLRPHRRGRQFDLVSEARLGDDIVWRGRSRYLHRGGGSGDGDGEREREEPSDVGLDVSAEWRVPGDIGRRYAGVSGDRNPIHMHSLSARLFGFPTAIAHGMWTKARCLAAFEGRTGETVTIDAEFRAPLRIPGRARLLTGREADGWRFRLESPDGARAHIDGTIALIQAPGR
jgi:acyl dehydratase